MIDPFAAMIDTCFATIGRAAVYSPANGGEPRPVRVIARRPDRVREFGDSRIVAASAVFDVRVAEIAQPAEGDTLTIDGDTFIIQGEPLRDAERLVWTLEARPG